jgi:hypothetical protein
MDKKLTTTAPQHTPFPWPRYENGGRLPGVLEKSGGFVYGPDKADWVWGPKGPGYGLVADCSPHGKATPESIANAVLIAALPDLVAVAELVCANLDRGHPLRAAAEIALTKAGRAP